MHLPDGLAAGLKLWKLECPDPSPEAFMFPNADGGFIDTSNYRNRILKPLGIQSHLRHSRADTTANEYMQELPKSVQLMVGTVYEMLTSATAR